VYFPRIHVAKAKGKVMALKWYVMHSRGYECPFDGKDLYERELVWRFQCEALARWAALQLWPMFRVPVETVDDRVFVVTEDEVEEEEQITWLLLKQEYERSCTASLDGHAPLTSCPSRLPGLVVQNPLREAFALCRELEDRLPEVSRQSIRSRQAGEGIAGPKISPSEDECPLKGDELRAARFICGRASTEDWPSHKEVAAVLGKAVATFSSHYWPKLQKLGFFRKHGTQGCRPPADRNLWHPDWTKSAGSGPDSVMAGREP
jgi:hypothetical protein